MKIFAHSPKDLIPAASALAHSAYLVLLFVIFPVTPWWLLIPLGFTYSVSISWNINGIAHNFIHNPYFIWSPLNRAFSWLLSVTMGFAQQFYDLVHHRHHQGNSDRKDENGDTVDWLSIYRHSHDDQAESPWTYTFFGYFRDDPKIIFNEIKRRSPFNARWGVIEIASWVFLVILGFFAKKRQLRIVLPYPEIPRTLAEHIRKRRIDLGLSQPEMAKIFGICRSTASEWECDESRPRKRFWVKIKEFVGSDLAAVIDRLLKDASV